MRHGSAQVRMWCERALRFSGRSHGLDERDLFIPLGSSYERLQHSTTSPLCSQQKTNEVQVDVFNIGPSADVGRDH
jgi:hypothetical protein